MSCGPCVQTWVPAEGDSAFPSAGTQVRTATTNNNGSHEWLPFSFEATIFYFTPCISF